MEDEVAAVTEMLRKFGFENGNKDELCFQINPPTELVKIIIKKFGQESRKGMELRPDEQGVVDLDNLVDDTDYNVEIFTLGVTPEILLHKFVIRKNNNGVSVRGVDTGATLIESLFKRKDEAFAHAIVLGDYTDNFGKVHKLNGKTSTDGSFKIALPPGSLDNLSAQSEDGTIVVPKRGKVIIPTHIASQTLRKAKSIKIEVDPSSFASAISSGDVVLLGDISGSMGGHGIEILRKSFQEIVDKAFSNQWKLTIGAWDSWVEWFSTTWINPSQKTDVLNYINTLNARGGNDMRYAIEEAMRKFPSATDVYVMCDGDISPFQIPGGKMDNLSDVPRPSAPGNESRGTTYNGTSWEAFRKRYPSTRFHFIALGIASSAVEMQQMADVGGGDFWESTSS